MEVVQKEKKPAFSTAELMQSFWYIAAVAFVGGFIDAYTYIVRGGVFANNQTGNVALLGIHLFKGNTLGVMNALLPVIATVLGAFAAEFVRRLCKNLEDGVWQQRALLCEIPIFAAAGFIPVTVPHAVVNVALSFIASFQLSAFRTYKGWVFNSTIMTGNLRSLGQYLYQAFFAEKNKAFFKKVTAYFVLILIFILGCFIGAMLSNYWEIRAIWICIPIPSVLVVVQYCIRIRTKNANENLDGQPAEE